MGIVNKYKVNDLAKDFGMQTKQIIEILAKFFPTPKKSGQNLEDDELNIVFEYLTQNNQVKDIQSIYADMAAEKPAPGKDAPPQDPKPAGKPQPAPAKGAQPRPQQKPPQQKPQQAQPVLQQKPAQPAAEPQQPGCPKPRWWIPVRPPT